MAESCWPASDNLYWGEHDPFGFEMMSVTISVRIQGAVIPRMTLRVVKSLYDQYREMGDEVLTEYLKNLAIEYLVNNMTITHATATH